MKIACNVCVSNRLLSPLALNARGKHVKSTVALCKNPKTNEYCLLLFTGQNKSGTKYNLKNNIQKILTRFINEGKATIQLKTPPHDLFVQAEVVQLKGFLHLLKRALENKISPNELTFSSMSVTPVAAKDLPKRKLVIKNRSDYPAHGFPRTLEILFINDIKRCSLDVGILQLTKLKVLNLSHNCIEFLPEQLNKLNLTELNVGFNCFNKSSPRQWLWMGGNLSKTLLYLNMESNNLQYLSDQLIKLNNLVTLHVQNNQIRSLPAGIGNLQKLRDLKAGDNLISVLPATIKKCQLERLELGNNKFGQTQSIPPSVCPKILPVATLKEITASAVLKLKILYSPSKIPATLVNYLDAAKYCICGKACFDVFIADVRALLLATFAEIISFSSTDLLMYVPVDCYFCSLRCYRNFSPRIRYPVIR